MRSAGDEQDGDQFSHVDALRGSHHTPPMRKALAATLLLAACGSKAPSTRARFDPDAALKAHDFFALPFPTDLRKTDTGLDLAGFPNPFKSELLSTFVINLR